MRVFRPGTVKTWWTARVRSRLEMAAIYDRWAERHKRSVLRATEFYELLERVEVEPHRREELRRDKAEIRLMAEWRMKRFEHHKRLAKLYRRAAYRPWLNLPPRPKLDLPFTISDSAVS
jgi:hypothetical protein